MTLRITRIVGIHYESRNTEDTLATFTHFTFFRTRFTFSISEFKTFAAVSAVSDIVRFAAVAINGTFYTGVVSVWVTIEVAVTWYESSIASNT